MADEYLDEQEQAEQLKRWFKENWLWMAAGVGLGLGGLYGWQGWNAHLDRRSAEAGERFGVLLQTLDRGDSEGGIGIVDEITAKYGATAYADQARLVAARVHVDAGDLDRAAMRLREVMDGAKDPELALLARLRLARVESAAGRKAEALALLDGARSPAATARIEELRGDLLHASGDSAAALAAYERARVAAAEPEAGNQVDLELLALKIDDLAAPAAGE